jgi:UDP-N-acetyl-D-glucosamine/UDP-N-acetyl-D-galactosamine dehydrogenase
MLNDIKIAVIGMGYVGLPLAVEFGKVFDTTGFDIDSRRIKELLSEYDSTLEIEAHEFQEAAMLSFTNNIDNIKDCNIYIVTVPTPIDKNFNPDLSSLIAASKAVGRLINRDDIVIYESTVYPGATEEVCVPILELASNLKYNRDFFCGYSPERINPGDKSHRLNSIIKVTSGSTKETADIVDLLYKKIITAGTFQVNSIKVAEAAKVIENTQRDLNIALINELSVIFDKLDIDTEAVLEAAATKWNFLSFKPGLVGGHCIGVDPYYLTHKAIQVGYQPEIILAGRRLNNNMGNYIVKKVINLMLSKGINAINSNILLMGFAFKENCPDIRNTRVIDLVKGFEEKNCNVDVYDPWVLNEDASKEYKIKLISKPINGKYDAVIIAVAHNDFKAMTEGQLRQYGKKNHILFDVKYILKSNQSDGRF